MIRRESQPTPPGERREEAVREVPVDKVDWGDLEEEGAKEQPVFIALRREAMTARTEVAVTMVLPVTVVMQEIPV
ncbi:MAG TPA: hypothetical protein VNM72_13965 [Blastocatellia bacterium]|nr:hypothetical protein [Blastocatellia bacterium]